VGYLVAEPALAADAVIVKQAADLHTSSLNQRLVHEVVAAPALLDTHVRGLRACYAERATALADALDHALGGRVRFDRPDGGLFLWATVPEEPDTAALLATALDRGVAFVPGDAFAVDPGGTAGQGAMRLSFASLAPADAPEAAARLVAALDERRRARPGRLDTAGARGG
jgi:2-aminoadipate transaminase